MKHSPKKFNIRYKAFFNSPSNNEIRAWIAQPLTFGCQKIESFSISPKPKNHYKDGQGNKILYFQFKNGGNIEIKIDFKATLWKDSFDMKKEIVLLNKDKKLKRFLKNEEFLKQMSEIKNLMNKITKDNKSDLDKIKSIFNFIVQNFKYCYPVKQRGVEKLNLNNLKGDCGEYSSLFVTMCRMLNIPARNNTGFIISPTYKKIVEHGWASLYLKSYGWIDFDTQYASTEKGRSKKYFGQRNDYRIIFINGFNVSLKPSIPKNFNLNFWNNIGIPLKNNSAQTLQPIIFTYKNDLNFGDEIKIKKP